MVQKIFLSIAIVFLLTGCSDESQEAQTSQSPQTLASVHVAPSPQDKTDNFKLIFFLDPNGRPCQMQHNILVGMQAELQPRVSIQLVQTTVASDRQTFYDYGIRSLPSLILVDGSGKEVRRLSPGVQDAEAIRTLLSSIPRS